MNLADTIPIPDPHRPWHILGIPGSGKSTLIGEIARRLQETSEKVGVIVIDIKDGELAEEVAVRADPDRLVYVAPGLAYEAGRSWAINPLDGNRSVVVDNVLDVFSRTGSLQSTFTLLRENLSMALRLAVSQPHLSTLHDVSLILTDPAMTRQMLDSSTLPDDRVRRFWSDWLKVSKNGQLAAAQRTSISSTMNVLDQWLVDDPLATVLAGQQSSLRLGQLLDEGKLIVCNLVDGIPPEQTKRFGNLVMATVLNTALARKRTPDRIPWMVLADEFDQLAGDFFVHALDKLRNARVFPVMAHQTIHQLNEPMTASLMSAPNKVYFKISPADVQPLSRMLGRDVPVAQFAKLPRHTARVSTGDDASGVLIWPALPEDEAWQEVELSDWPKLDPATHQSRLASVEASQLAMPWTHELGRMEGYGHHEETPRQPPVQKRPAQSPALRDDRAGAEHHEVTRRAPLRHQRPD